jgi:hypothetical protein
MEIDSAFEIDNTSPEERKELFLRYFDNREVSRMERETLPIHMTRSWIQNPYKPKTWPMRDELMRMSLRQRDSFSQRYRITNKIKVGSGSITQPDLWHIASITDYYKEILYNNNGLFMKVVPLINDARLCDQHSDEFDCRYKK